MSILINKDTKVITQGITGKTGQFHTEKCQEYANGKNCFVAGVNPKKAGEAIFGIPIFGTVKEAAQQTGATVSVIYVPPAGAENRLPAPSTPPRMLLMGSLCVFDCVLLTPENVRTIPWLPKTCAYRLVAEGRDLPDWHPLKSGDVNSVHKSLISVRGKITAFEDDLNDTDDYLLHLLKREP